jgi:branched-chain amino acid transport system ATP-binding protein
VPLLELKQLSAGHGHQRVLEDLDLWIDPAEIVAILGANGAGNTATLRAISGTTRREGHIRFSGQWQGRLDSTLQRCETCLRS